jgi:hypothetical protein
MADQNDIRQALLFDEVHHVGDVGLEINVRAHQMDALAQPCECRRIGFMAGRAQCLCDRTPVPAADPGAMNQNEARHLDLPSQAAAC